MCIMFGCLLVSFSFEATCLSLAHTGIRADSPSGKHPTTRVLRRISRLSDSRILFVRMFCLSSWAGTPGRFAFPVRPSRTHLRSNSISSRGTYSSIPGLGECRIRTFLGVGGFEKNGDGGELIARHLREHVPEEVYCATLPFRVGIDLQCQI